MSPSGTPSHQFKYVYHNFSLEPHVCKDDCSCREASCTQHWRWKDGQPPPMATVPWDYRCVDYELWAFGAYQGPVPGKTKQERFLANYQKIVEWVRQLDGMTIFCNWDSTVVEDVFENVKKVFAGHSVPAAKALYFFVPDLFIILDRAKVWDDWKSECKFLPNPIDNVSGKDYVALMQHVGTKISSSIQGGRAFTLDGSPPIKVNSVEQLRLVTPLRLETPQKIGHTIGKVIDNIF